MSRGILNKIGKVSLGQLFENTVFHQLFLKSYFQKDCSLFGEKIFYFHKKTGAEIDFILKNEGYEVKLSGTQKDILRFSRFGQKIGLGQVKIVSLEKVDTKEGIIYPFQI